MAPNWIDVDGALMMLNNATKINFTLVRETIPWRRDWGELTAYPPETLNFIYARTTGVNILHLLPDTPREVVAHLNAMTDGAMLARHRGGFVEWDTSDKAREVSLRRAITIGRERKHMPLGPTVDA
jgi:hypothetical protein